MDKSELSDVAYLRDLAERLMHVPAIYGTDGYDVDRLQHVAREIEVLSAQLNAASCPTE